MQEKESIMVVRNELKIPSLGMTVPHHLASLVMPNSYPCDKIFQYANVSWPFKILIIHISYVTMYHCGFEPGSGHIWDKLSYGSQVFFLWDFPFSPYLTTDSPQMSLIILTGHNTQIKNLYRPILSAIMNHFVLINISNSLLDIVSQVKE